MATAHGVAEAMRAALPRQLPWRCDEASIPRTSPGPPLGTAGTPHLPQSAAQRVAQVLEGPHSY